MSTYGDSFSTTLPAVGSSGPQYATDMNSILTDIMTRLSSKIPLSSLLVTTDLSLAGFNLTNATSLGMVNVSGTGFATAVPRVMVVNGNLTYVGPSGAVQMTSGTNLNAAGLAGITGDYGGANPAQFRYDSANTRYDAFANQGTGQWAYARALGFDIAAGTTSSVRARLAYLGGSNVTYTLPTAPPASVQTLVQMDTSGNMSVSNSLASGVNLGLQGTGRITRGARQTTVPICWALGVQFTGATGATHATGDPGVGIPLGADVIFPIQLPDADQQLTTVTSVAIDHTLSGTGTFNFNLYKGNLSGFTFLTGATASGTGTILLTPSTPFTPAPTDTLWVRFTNVSGTITGNVYSARINTTVS